MHAFIIIAQNSDDRKNEVDKLLQKHGTKSIPVILQKIDDTRELKKMTKFSFSEKTAFVIEDIDQASTEALNAFLKNLEEPSKNTIYILTSSNLENILPTIVSRCEVINVGSVKKEIDKEIIENFIEKGIDERLEIVGKIKDRGEAIKFIEEIIYIEHERKNFENMENCLNILKNLKANGNVSLQLTAFVVTMNR